MVALSGVPLKPEPPVPDPNDSSSYQFRPRAERRFGLRVWGAGLLAIAVALLPFPVAAAVVRDGGGPEGMNLTPALVAFGGVFIALAAWAAIRAHRAGRPTWPPLVVTFMFLPIAFFGELFIGGPMAMNDGGAYLWLALGIAVAIIGLGITFSLRARRS
jgi:hypothetical protein